MIAYRFRIPGLSQIGPEALQQWDLTGAPEAIENAFDQYCLYPDELKCTGDTVSFELGDDDLRDLDRLCRKHMQTRKGMLAIILEEGVADLIDRQIEVEVAR
jgi:hypothetical protein